MSNKLETVSSSRFLQNKINLMLSNLNSDFAALDTRTKEDIIGSFNETVKMFYRTIDKPLFTYKEFQQGKTPNIKELNTSLRLASQDIQIMYTELSSIRERLAANFNSVNGQILKIKSNIADVSSTLTDYKIQNTNGRTPTFFDLFVNQSKIETNDKSFDKDKAFIDTKNGRVTLPLDGEAEQLKPKRIQIIDGSNGTSGNNHEIGAVARDNIQLLIDGNMDTWFEYEQVSQNKITVPTILGLKIEFEQEKVFNLLDIASIAFPNGSYPAILEIKGSIDGSIFFDLKPYYIGELTKDSVGNEVIQLGERLENPADANMLLFHPRKLKYLIIKFIEDAPYLIRTPTGIKNRIAIGIKEIKAKSQKYKIEGQLISSTHVSPSEINKVALSVQENIPEGFDTKFEYFISPDEGKSWEQISPTEKSDSSIPEVLNYNLDFLQDAKKTEKPVSSIKLKVNLSISQSESSTNKGSSFKKKDKTEFQTIGSTVAALPLEQSPLDAVDMYQINFGSIGDGLPYKMRIVSTEEKAYAILPPEIFYLDGALALANEDIQVVNDGIIYAQTLDLSTKTATDKVYKIDRVNGVIIFSETVGGVQHGKIPSSETFLKIKREKANIERGDSTATVTTKFQSDMIKENIRLYQVSDEIKTVGIKLRHLACIHRLNVSEIVEVIIPSGYAVLGNRVDFVNGMKELRLPGDFSIDMKSGILYTFSEVANIDDIIITVKYYDRSDIPFEIKDGAIQVPISNYTSKAVTKEIKIAQKTFAINLGLESIEKRSIQFIKFPNNLGMEVSINDMHLEFNKNSENKYAIDYSNGILYSRNGVSEDISFTASITNYYIEYRMAYKIPSNSYTVIKDQKKIEFTNKYVSDNYIDSQNNSSQSQFYKIEYSYAEEIKESTGDTLQYTTPLLLKYEIQAVSKETML